MSNISNINPETGEEIEAFFDWPTGKPHISFSELSNWLECAYRHKLLYIDKVGQDEPSPYLSLGSAVHSSCENYIKTRKMDNEIAFAIIKNAWEKDGEFFTSKEFGTVDQWLFKANRILNDVPQFLDSEYPGWECYAAEELLYEEITNHKIKFKGYIDAILTVNDKRGKKKYVIIDWKTCSWGWSANKKQNFNVQLQLILYKIFWAKKHDISLKDIKCVFVLLKRDGKPGNSVGLVSVSVGPKTKDRGLNVIQNHVRSVSRGMFFKNRSSCKYCQFEESEYCKQNL